MARHPFSPRAGRKTRNWTYTILLAVLVICVVIAFYYGPFGKNEADTIDIAPDGDMDVDTTAVDETDVPYETEIVKEPVVTQEPVVAREPEMSRTTAYVPPVEVEKVPELPKIAPEPTPGQTIEPNPEAAALIANATALLSETPSKIVEAREKLNQALRMPMSPQQRSSVINQLSEDRKSVV